MACLGTIDVVEKLIEATATDGTTTLSLTGIAAEVAFDGTAHAIMKLTGDPLMQVNTVNGDVEGIISMKDTAVSVTTLVALTGLGTLDIDTITAGVADDIATITFNGTPDLSAVRVGDRIEITGAAAAGNDGLFTVLSVVDGTDTITYENASAVDAVTDAAGTAAITSPAIHDVVDTRDYCDCNGLCYVEEEIQ